MIRRGEAEATSRRDDDTGTPLEAGRKVVS
jgi:hypothetical protein